MNFITGLTIKVMVSPFLFRYAGRYGSVYAILSPVIYLLTGPQAPVTFWSGTFHSHLSTRNSEDRFLLPAKILYFFPGKTFNQYIRRPANSRYTLCYR